MPAPQAGQAGLSEPLEPRAAWRTAGSPPQVVRLICTRVLTLLGSMVVASLLVFLAVQALPGDLAQVLLGDRATPQQLAQLRAQLGLDRPLGVRYLDWIAGLVRGDLGIGLMSRVPVSELLAGPFAVTLWLVVLTMLISIPTAVLIGLWAALRRRHWDGFVVNGLSQLGMAVPAFLAGLVLVLVVAVKGQLLPAGGYTPLTSDPVKWASRLVLPVASLSLVQTALLVRYARSAFVDVMAADHLTTARSVGFTRVGALVKHGLRHAGLSLVTVVGLQLASLFVGAIVVENVFVLPGVGSLLLRAVGQRDFIVVQSVVMVLVVIVLVVNALVDVIQVLLDPRLRSEAAG